VSKLSSLFHIIPDDSTSGCFVSLNNFKQNVLVLFLHSFTGQRSLNNTLEGIEHVHANGIRFMEAAKRLFPDRNRSQNSDGSMMGWIYSEVCGNFIPFYTRSWIFFFMDGQKMSVLTGIPHNST
jgi:hypothetical protein